MSIITGLPQPVAYPVTEITLTTGSIPTYLGLVDCLITADGAYTLPPLQPVGGAMIAGGYLSIRNRSGFVLTISAAAGDTIDSGPSLTINNDITADLIATPTGWKYWSFAEF